MTREEAEKIIKHICAVAIDFGVMPTRDILQARDIVIDGAKFVQPSINQCGCGGKGRKHQAYDGLWIVQCDRCSISTMYRKSVNDCINDWNAAMGVKA